MIHNGTSKTITVGALKQGKTLQVSKNIITLIKKKKRNTASQKHEKSSTSEENAKTKDTDIMTNDLLSALQQSEKEVTDDVERQILDVVTSLSHQSEDVHIVDTPDDDILQSSVIEEIFSENILFENPVSMEDSTPKDFRHVHRRA